MRRRRIRRVHFAFVRIDTPAQVAAAVRVGHMAPMREVISKVYGASPAIVFAPPGPIASIRRCLTSAAEQVLASFPEAGASVTRRKRVPSAKQRAAWDRWAAIQNDARDHIHGYDDGEWREPRHH